jgi:hypothetical protein
MFAWAKKPQNEEGLDTFNKRNNTWCVSNTDKKENKTFLIYKEIQMGSGAKSYMTNGLLIYGEKFAHFLKY